MKPVYPFLSTFNHAMARGSRGVVRVIESASPFGVTLRTAAQNACTPGNLAVLCLAGLALGIGMLMMMNDPIETHHTAVPQAVVTPVAQGLTHSNAALATAGLSTEAGGFGQIGAIAPGTELAASTLSMPEQSVPPAPAPVASPATE